MGIVENTYAELKQQELKNKADRRDCSQGVRIHPQEIYSFRRRKRQYQNLMER